MTLLKGEFPEIAGSADKTSVNLQLLRFTESHGQRVCFPIVPRVNRLWGTGKQSLCVALRDP